MVPSTHILRQLKEKDIWIDSWRARHTNLVGYASAGKVLLQVSKDAELISTGQIQSSTWHFFSSPVTGLIGPAPAVRDALNIANIQIILHF